MKITKHTTLDNNETVEQWAASRELSIAEALRILKDSVVEGEIDLNRAHSIWANDDYWTDAHTVHEATQLLGLSGSDYEYAIDSGLVSLQDEPNLTIRQLADILSDELSAD